MFGDDVKGVGVACSKTFSEACHFFFNVVVDVFFQHSRRFLDVNVGVGFLFSKVGEFSVTLYHVLDFAPLGEAFAVVDEVITQIFDVSVSVHEMIFKTWVNLSPEFMADWVPRFFNEVFRFASYHAG